MILLVTLLRKLFSLSLALSVCVMINACILFLISAYSCQWPCTDCKDPKWLKVMVLTDVHLLGKRKGHPVDQFVRETEMSLAFRTAQAMHKPNLVIFLGDNLDEGLTVDQEEFFKYVYRFKETFPMDETSNKIFIVGNHDIGFHDRAAYYPRLRTRWEKAFNSSLSELITINNIKFITINSMAIEGAGQELVQETEKALVEVEKKLNSLETPGRPILLSHFPLYRKNDDNCHEPDSQVTPGRLHKFTPGVECLSPKTSERLLNRFNPRLILDGHIHAGCITEHSSHNAQEWTVASFNWRNGPMPNYLLLQLSPDHQAITKCFLPSEFTILGASILFLFLVRFTNHFLLKNINFDSAPKEAVKKSKKSD